jgi:hypothetical protein
LPKKIILFSFSWEGTDFFGIFFVFFCSSQNISSQSSRKSEKETKLVGKSQTKTKIDKHSQTQTNAQIKTNRYTQKTKGQLALGRFAFQSHFSVQQTPSQKIEKRSIPSLETFIILFGNFLRESEWRKFVRVNGEMTRLTTTMNGSFSFSSCLIP